MSWRADSLSLVMAGPGITPCCKTIFGVSASNIDSRSSLDATLIQISARPEIREALGRPGRTGVRKIAARFGVSPDTVQRISRPFEHGPSVAAA
jgi:hypothetical protein